MRRSNHLRRQFSRRALVIGGIQSAVFATLTGRLYDMQVIDHRRYRMLAADNAIRSRPVLPPRGLITDRNNIALATNHQQWHASFLMTATHDPMQPLMRVATLLHLPDAEKQRFAQLACGKPHYLPVSLLENLDWQQMAILETNKLFLPGVIIDRGYCRVYPLGPISAHIVGYVVRPSAQTVEQDPLYSLPGARIGGSGVERARNEVLLGQAGLIADEVNAGGAVIRQIRDIAPVQGQAVQLTLDANLQTKATSLLAKRPGAAVLLDAQKGDILAMASAPSFDPSWFENGVPEAIWRQWNLPDSHQPLMDRSTNGLYAPGSSFKPTAALAALQCGAISSATHFFCAGHMKIGDRMFYCWKRSGHGLINVVQAIQQSCDIFFYHVAMEIGIDRMAAMGQILGLTTRVPIDLPDVESGFLPTTSWAKAHHIDWTTGDTAIQGIGQGYTLLTPLALAIMTARIATGQHVVPRLYAETPYATSQSLEITPEHLSLVRMGMSDVVNTPLGTAWGGRFLQSGLKMAGKTGTAQVFGESSAMEAEDYNDADLPWNKRPNALFVAYAPVQNPVFAAAIVVEHGSLLDPVTVAAGLFDSAFKAA